MRDRFPALVAFGLALVVVLAVLVSRGTQRGAFAPPLSTYRSDSEGARGLYLLAERSGLPVTRWQLPYHRLDGRAPVVLLGVGFESNALPELKSLFASDGGSELPSDNQVDADELKVLLDHLRVGNHALALVAPTAQQRLLDAVHVRFVTLPDGGAEPTDGGLQHLSLSLPSNYTQGVISVETPVSGALILPSEATPLLEDDDGRPVGALVRVGSGSLVVLAAPALGMNANLARADNAQLWLSLLRTLSGGQPLAVDELHHGFAGQRSIASFARRYGLGFAVGQLLLGLFAWAAALRRFGPPRPEEQVQRRAGLDALAATGELYRSGHHAFAAAQLLLKGTGTALARSVGMPSVASPELLARELKGRGETAVAEAFLALVPQATSVNGEAALQAFATECARLRAQVRPRRRESPFRFHMPTTSSAEDPEEP